MAHRFLHIRSLYTYVHKLHHRFSPSGLDSHDMPNELPAGVQPLPAGGRSDQDPAERSWAGGIASWLGGKGSKGDADASAVAIEMEEAAGAGSPPAREAEAPLRRWH